MTNGYVCYETTTGRILKTAKVAFTPEEGVSQLQLDVPDFVGLTHYVHNGSLVAFPPKLSDNHNFDYSTKQWLDPRTLVDLKTSKYAEINSERLRANQSHFIYSGKQIAVDGLSRSDIDVVHGIVTLTNGMPDGWVGGWKAVDNTYVGISDVAAWTLFYKAMVAQGSANFARSQALKAQLAAATTIAEVEAIVW